MPGNAASISVTDPGCFFFRIPDPNFSISDPNFSIPDPGSASKNSSTVFLTQNLFLRYREYDPGCSMFIPDPDFFLSRIRIPDKGVNKTTGSETLVAMQGKINSEQRLGSERGKNNNYLPFQQLFPLLQRILSSRTLQGSPPRPGSRRCRNTSPEDTWTTGLHSHSGHINGQWRKDLKTTLPGLAH